MYHFVLSALILATPVHSQTDTVLRGEGSPMNTQVVGSLRLNEDSNLNRRWIIVNDPALAAQLDGARYQGVRPTYSDSARGYQYWAMNRVEFSEPVVAIQINHILFDIWNSRVRTLRFDDVADHDEGAVGVRGEWPLVSEAEAARHLTTLSYVYRVRLADGEIQSADMDAVLEQVQSIAQGSTLADLSPED